MRSSANRHEHSIIRPLARLSVKWDAGSTLLILTAYHARQPRGFRRLTGMLPPPVIERRQSNAALLTKLPPPKPAGFPFVQHPPHLGRPFRLFTHAAIFGFLWLTFKMDSSDAYRYDDHFL